MARPRLPRLTFGGNLPGVERVNRWIEDVLSSIERATNVTFEGNVNVSENADGMKVNIPRFGISLIKTTSAVPPRSGVTPGQGTADHVMFNGTTLISDASRLNQKVFNFSAASAGVATGKYGVAVRLWGYWFILTVEC